MSWAIRDDDSSRKCSSGRDFCLATLWIWFPVAAPVTHSTKPGRVKRNGSYLMKHGIKSIRLFVAVVFYLPRLSFVDRLINGKVELRFALAITHASY